MNNIRQVGLALLNYHDVHGSFPPAYTVDADGKPLHSWRTLILPFLDQAELYKQIDLTKPWDAPAHEQIGKSRVWAYQCPYVQPGMTTYLAIVAPGSCIAVNKVVKIDEITDGTATTLLLIEAPLDKAVPWMSPWDADESLLMNLSDRSKLAHRGGVNCIMADGSGRFVSVYIDKEILRALITGAAGDSTGNSSDQGDL